MTLWWFFKFSWVVALLLTPHHNLATASDALLSVIGFIDQVSVRQGIPFDLHVTIVNPTKSNVRVTRVAVVSPKEVITVGSDLGTLPLVFGPLDARTLTFTLKASKPGDFHVGIYLVGSDLNRSIAQQTSVATIGVVPAWIPEVFVSPKDATYVTGLITAAIGVIVTIISLFVTGLVNRAQMRRSDRRSQIEVMLPKVHETIAKYYAPTANAAWRASDAMRHAFESRDPASIRQSLFLLATHNAKERETVRNEPAIFLSDLDGERIVRTLQDELYDLFPEMPDGGHVSSDQFYRQDLTEVTNLYESCNGNEDQFSQEVTPAILSRYGAWLTQGESTPGGSVLYIDFLRLYREVMLFEVNVPYGPWYRERGRRFVGKNKMTLSKDERKLLSSILEGLYDSKRIGVKGRLRYLGRIRTRK